MFMLLIELGIFVLVAIFGALFFIIKKQKDDEGRSCWQGNLPRALALVVMLER